MRRALAIVLPTLLLRAAPVAAQLTLPAAWTSTEIDSTRSVAWADWDGDGDSDLAVSGRAVGIRIYRNDGGSLVLAWESGVIGEVYGLAWGDWDGDGDPDLAVALGWETPAPNRVYRNDGGSLTLAWESPETDRSISVAWGDWDGDGAPDLAVGNGGSEPNRVYRNDGGRLVLAWSAPMVELTHSVAWGDWDGDGFDDLAVGNGLGNPKPNRVYRSDGAGNLTLAWTSTELDDTRSVAWGDWDGDGDLDLAAGNYMLNGSIEDPNRVYRNDGGSLTLAWTSPEMDSTVAIAWGDWDGDGDLDLAAGNGGRSVDRVYCNNRGNLLLAWTSTELDNSHAAAWGDVDGDGRFDLLIGNNGAPNRLYLACHRAPLTSRGASLRAVKRGAAAAEFSWSRDPLATGYHLNAVTAKSDLVPPGPYRPPVPGGVGRRRCEAFEPAAACSDDRAILDPPALLYYQVVSACSSICSPQVGSEEGPL